jgi:hypothetical protein
LVALAVFAVLGIFSAKYRRWAKEAFNCVARRMILRPCNTGFNEKVKAKVTSKLLTKSPKLAKFTHRYFEAISWVFTISMFVSMFYSAYSLYNLAYYGTCDPSNPGSCVFTVSHDQGPCVNNTNTTLSAAGHDCIPCVCRDREIRCDAPEWQACEGNCDCVEEMCSSGA